MKKLCLIGMVFTFNAWALGPIINSPPNLTVPNGTTINVPSNNTNQITIPSNNNAIQIPNTNTVTIPNNNTLTIPNGNSIPSVNIPNGSIPNNNPVFTSPGGSPSTSIAPTIVAPSSSGGTKIIKGGSAAGNMMKLRRFGKRGDMMTSQQLSTTCKKNRLKLTDFSTSKKFRDYKKLCKNPKKFIAMELKKKKKKKFVRLDGSFSTPSLSLSNSNKNSKKNKLPNLGVSNKNSMGIQTNSIKINGLENSLALKRKERLAGRKNLKTLERGPASVVDLPGKLKVDSKSLKLKDDSIKPLETLKPLGTVNLGSKENKQEGLLDKAIDTGSISPGVSDAVASPEVKAAAEIAEEEQLEPEAEVAPQFDGSEEACLAKFNNREDFDPFVLQTCCDKLSKKFKYDNVDQNLMSNTPPDLNKVVATLETESESELNRHVSRIKNITLDFGSIRESSKDRRTALRKLSRALKLIDKVIPSGEETSLKNTINSNWGKIGRESIIRDALNEVAGRAEALISDAKTHIRQYRSQQAISGAQQAIANGLKGQVVGGPNSSPNLGINPANLAGAGNQSQNVTINSNQTPYERQMQALLNQCPGMRSNLTARQMTINGLRGRSPSRNNIR